MWRNFAIWGAGLPKIDETKRLQKHNNRGLESFLKEEAYWSPTFKLDLGKNFWNYISGVQELIDYKHVGKNINE